jgi:hypothetical protein
MISTPNDPGCVQEIEVGQIWRARGLDCHVKIVKAASDAAPYLMAVSCDPYTQACVEILGDPQRMSTARLCQDYRVVR